MAASSPHLSQLVNPLVSVDQLASSGSQLDGVPSDLESSCIYAGAQLMQIAGILLRLPQDIIAQAIVIFSRFWIGSDGGSLREFGVKDVSLASIYLMVKLSAYPKAPRSVINVFGYLDSFHSTLGDLKGHVDTNNPESYYVSEGTYVAQRAQLTKMETIILKVLGFQTHVALPYNICINYLQALDVFVDHETASHLAKRAFAHLNSALLSPQLLYLTHQPPALATAAIYLSAKETGVKLPDAEWWEVFDTDREELGFLVVAMISMEDFVKEENVKWENRKAPSTLIEMENELERKATANGHH
ncbi:hypothetical protein EJ08DRAFT_135338 [Tothia fuscella]|uniref:Uncharacterized protein n=1 Tax=Tothia fuscella TaxID=1048955 RepID=A0A9P4NDM1_9PEZI|nr:hypothetical protein EJ08DRAFT_135338 [Tothia fuscella]